jgi:hypothetical protein
VRGEATKAKRGLKRWKRSLQRSNAEKTPKAETQESKRPRPGLNRQVAKERYGYPGEIKPLKGHCKAEMLCRKAHERKRWLKIAT